MNSIRILENAKKTEDQIRKKLSQEGFSETEINDSYKELEAINKDKQDLSEKKSNVAIIDTLNKNSAIIRTKLKAEGFSDKQIQVALGQLRNDYKEKEKILKESLAEKDVKIKE